MRVCEPRSHEPTCSQHVRFSFEATHLQHAVDVARQLRRANPTGVRVRPLHVARANSCHWAILVTTPVLGAGRIADLEEEMWRVARRAPGITFTGWLHLAGSGESAPSGNGAASARATARVLIVDDSDAFRRAASDLLRHQGYRVIGVANTAAAGFEAAERLKPDAVLLDVRLPDGSGLDLCEVLTSEPDAPAVLLVSTDCVADAVLAEACGASGFVPKADLARVDLSRVWG